MLDQVFALDGLRMQVNYGGDGCGSRRWCRWIRGVRAGVELVAVKPVAIGRQIRTKVTVERSGSEKPVCVIDVLRVAAS